MKKIIPITHPHIDKYDIKNVAKAAKNGWGPKCYDQILELEKNFSKKFGFKFSLATSSCTGALHMGLISINIKKGDEVILPDCTWISCSNVLEYIGAKPIFADIKKDTWCLDPADVEKKITKKTKAIMCVHLYGNVCDMDSFLKLKKKYKLLLIEDCAEALGAKYKNKSVGSIGDFSVFSFHGTKLITGGEGGMFVTNSLRYYKIFQKMHRMGIDHKETRFFFHSSISYKYKISNLQAALINSQLKKINKLIEIKKKIFNKYKKEFNDEIFEMNFQEKKTKSVYWMSTLVINSKINIYKEKLINYCKSKNIHLRPFFYPISSFPIYKKSKNKIAYSTSKKSVNLPSGYHLTDKDIKFVASTIKNFIFIEDKLNKINKKNLIQINDYF